VAAGRDGGATGGRDGDLKEAARRTDFAGGRLDGRLGCRLMGSAPVEEICERALRLTACERIRQRQQGKKCSHLTSLLDHIKI
jgi:hypothetical protein